MQIPDARLLISDVDGHRNLMWSRCAYETVVRFLRDPASPELTAICPTEWSRPAGRLRRERSMTVFLPIVGVVLTRGTRRGRPARPTKR